MDADSTNNNGGSFEFLAVIGVNRRAGSGFAAFVKWPC